MNPCKIRPKEARINKLLLDALARIDRPGDIFAAGDRELVLPGLEIEGIGAVGLPLPETQARDLV